jgi:methyl-accepting chemotaxis protein
MQQPDNSNASRSLVFITLAALVLCLAAGFGLFSGTAAGKFGGVLSLLALVPLGLLFLSVRAGADEAAAARMAVESQRRENERNQGAILRLLDEIAGLGTGDLTATATVTEDITGAIADSINYAVESLRGLVTTINASRRSARRRGPPDAGAAQHLAKSSSAQSKQIASATESIAAMASLPPRKSPATPSAPPTSRVIRWTSPTRAATPCAARSTA